jgi:hypothetical protein
MEDAGGHLAGPASTLECILINGLREAFIQTGDRTAISYLVKTSWLAFPLASALRSTGSAAHHRKVRTTRCPATQSGLRRLEIGGDAPRVQSPVCGPLGARAG